MAMEERYVEVLVYVQASVSLAALDRKMTDLYDVLGVSKAADRKEIRAAYRKIAKSAHPDTGGSAKMFALVKKAHDILTDDERRRKYDATGDESEAAVDNTLGNAMQCLQVMFDKILQECLQKHVEPTEIDLIEVLRLNIGKDISEAQKNLTTLREMIKVDEKLVKRFSRKKKIAAKKSRELPPNFDVFENLIKGRLTALNTRISQLEDHVSKSEYVLELIDDYIYKKDEVRSNVQTRGNFTFMTLGGM